MLRRIKKQDIDKRDDDIEEKYEAINILNPVEENDQVIKSNQENLINDNIRKNENVLGNNVKENSENNLVNNNPSINQENVQKNNPTEENAVIKKDVSQEALGKDKEYIQQQEDKSKDLFTNKPNEELKPDNKLQNEFKNIFKGDDLLSNNNYRKRLMHLVFICIVIDLIFLEILCLYLNVCYGEVIEMQKWVSNSIVPLGLILLLLYIMLYSSSDSISKSVINISNILITIILIFFFGIGIFTIGFAASSKIDDLDSSWNLLSKQSKMYYYDNDINVLFSTYINKMMVTGILYLVQAVLGIIVICFSYRYHEKLTYDWRPPLRTRLSDERAKRYIDIYSKFNKDYKRLYELENFKTDKDKIINKVNDIIDGVPDLPVRNLNNKRELIVDQINNNDNLNKQYDEVKKSDNISNEESPNQNLIESNQLPRRNILRRRKKGDGDEN
jgi:hypothetical protein